MPNQHQFNNYEKNNKNQKTEKNRPIKHGIQRKHSVTVLTSPEMAYAFWRDFSNFPLFMKDISEVKIVSPKVSHWVVSMENGPDIEWDAEIINEREGEMISWKSIGDSPVEQAGSVWFRSAPANMGTVVSVSMSYSVPAGKLGELASKLLGDDPDTLILTNLRRFKAYIETGEIPTIEGQPNGKDADTIPSVTH
jgi:uncharacterized membrane protein